MTGAQHKLKVLSLTALYPGPNSPQAGLFVRARLLRLGELSEVVVMAPAPLLRLVSSGRGGLRLSRQSVPQQDGPLLVLRPRWLYVPGVESALPLELAAGLAAPFLLAFRQHRFDVIDAHFGYPMGVAAALLAELIGRPFVITLRGSETVHSCSALPRRWLSWAITRAAAVICVSRPLREFAFSLGARPEDCHVIPNGVDAAVFHPRGRDECRRALGMDAGALHILSAGHVIEAKGHHLATAALAALIAAGLDVRLWVVGGPGHGHDYTRTIRQTAASAGIERRVHFTGSVPAERVAEYMSAADLLCLASYSEGWPNVVTEALACGTPVVATRVGGVPEMLIDGRYGLIVPPRDQEALTAALDNALRRPWDRDAIAAWGRSRSWEQVAEDAARVLHAAVTGGGPTS